MDLVRMAWRNVFRHRRRSAITISAMAFALAVLIQYMGLLQGMVNGFERDVVEIEVGDVQIFAPEYREDPSIYERIDDPEALLAPLDAAGFRASPRLLAFGLAAAEDASAGVSFRGLDVERDARVSLIHRELDRGAWLDPGSPEQVVLGYRVARALGVDVGDEVLVLSAAADGSMAYDLYTIRGVLRSVAEATDRSGFFMTAAAFRELFAVPDGVHQIVVRRPADSELAAAAALVRAMGADVDVRTWRQLMPTVASYVDLARQAIYIVGFIVYLAVALLILNAMLMAVFERIREIGVLKALGVGPVGVIRLVAVESAIQTGIAILVGLAVGVPGLYYLSTRGLDLSALGGFSIMGLSIDPIWYAEFEAGVVVAPIGLLIFMVSAAALYPTLKAALIEPVTAIHHQ